jgi:hypothetical protein
MCGKFYWKLSYGLPQWNQKSNILQAEQTVRYRDDGLGRTFVFLFHVIAELENTFTAMMLRGFKIELVI